MQPRGLPYPHIQPSAAAAVGVMAERRAAKPEIGSQKCVKRVAEDSSKARSVGNKNIKLPKSAWK